jgi:hypothetical protein
VFRGVDKIVIVTFVLFRYGIAQLRGVLHL